ncbi:sensor histidine kinase [Sanyastnella coralliicola]|uniref:sensor histidine kinase n=1 Tax=Sanyastnella coralliicola TaxID=3069118 RepID=UPI0027B89F21|nr:PAS domain-containing sensor histidine kinase [Longitalea sp. SCSIO 12813]
MNQSSEQLAPGLQSILDQLICIAQGQDDCRVEITGEDETLDAITVGLNMLTEELTKRDESIRDQNRLFETMLEAVAESIVLVETDGFTLLVANQAYEKRFDKKVDNTATGSVEGRTLMDAARLVGYQEEKINFFNEWILETIRTRKRINRLEEDEFESGMRYFSSSITPIVEGDHVKYLAYVSREITEEVESSFKLSISESRLKQAQRISNVGHFNFSLLDQSLSWSDQLKRIFELPEGQDPTYEFFLKSIAPEHQELMNNVIGNAIQNGENFEVPHRMVTPSGESKYLLCSGEAVQENGQTIAIMGVAHEVTKDVLAKQRIEQQKIALEESNRKLSTANNRLEELAYIASHDLKAPLLNFNALLEMLEGQEELGEFSKTLIAKMKQSAGGMNQTIQGLNTVLENFQQQEEAEVCDIPSIIDQVQLSIGSLIERESAQINVSALAIEKTRFNKQRLESIVQNLVGNSLKYRQEDLAPAINISSYTKDDEVVLEVADNGIGIDLEINGDRMFGLFKRFHTHVEGRGIGLHMINSFVADAGGHIEVESEVNKGTTFKVHLGPESIAHEA